ncbi:hypothetical protein A6A04_11255 [Paramagnetospirillum marisnigri]|uniref:Flagellin N-terminal domain-containing protein n=1 Tax=Paramagnetospirillum marisnigri TaxID=1285242 RepID=A0A178MWY8_9PROT|nr:hypothetical protein [Paramagnetospirillum marisnigri]OAN55231.1 hypothetical protein A6A04_11255 [Paramagnetospirillum marisnigri]
MALSPITTATSQLSSIQRNQALQDRENQRLSTGRKVNSALDDSRAYALASGLLERADTLAQAGQSIGQGIGAIQAADAGLSAISKVVDQLKAVAKQAQASSDPTEQANLQAQYNTLRSQIDSLATDASYQGTNLIAAKPSTLAVDGGSGQTATTITGKAADATSLGVTAAAGWAGNTNAIEADLAALDQASRTVRVQAAELGGNVARLRIQADYVQAQGNIARQGASQLTAADLNESAASVRSADTYRKLGVQALRNQVRTDDSVLALFSRR